MSMVRVLLALLLLPLAIVLPATTSVQAHPRSYGIEHCILSTGEEMELILMRRSPNTHALIEKRLQVGECGLRVVDNCKYGWCPVKQGHFRGWVMVKNLVPVSEPVYCVARVDRGWTLDLHIAPSRSSRVVATVDDDFCGITLTPNRVGHWVEVKVGRTYGWVSSTNVR